MSTFYIDLLSIFFLFLTSLTCFFALFSRNGSYWILPWLASSILGLIRLFHLIDQECTFTVVEGRSLYIEMLTPVALLILFLSSLILRYGIGKRTPEKEDHANDYFNRLQDIEGAHDPIHCALSQQDPADDASGPAEDRGSADDGPEDVQTVDTFIQNLIAASLPLPHITHTHYIYILGIKHSGKSALGKATADMLSITFFDLDAMILELCDQSPLSGLSIREIYKLVGKDQFMLLEVIALNQFIYFSEHSRIPGVQEHIIIALGGGACDNEPLMELLQNTGYLIYLEAPEALLYSRIIQGGIPPFLDPEDPEASFHDLYVQRDRRYKQYADDSIPISVSSEIEENALLLVKSIQRVIGEVDEQ